MKQRNANYNREYMYNNHANYGGDISLNYLNNNNNNNNSLKISARKQKLKNISSAGALNKRRINQLERISGNNIEIKMVGHNKNVRRGLEPLEFEECIVDSPEFRDNLNRHEKELDHTSHQIKRIIKEVKDLMSAAKVLSTRMKQLANLLNDFNFECIGTTQTDDENVICESLKHFGAIIGTIEDEREKMLTLADKHIIEPLEDFRKKQIGGVKENKKKFDKKTEKFCQSQERFLNMSTKKPENTIQEADASLGMHEREYVQESLSYVLRIQEVQERIKFEFVEILLAFISGWLVFYHTAHEQAEDNRDYLQDLRHKVQKTRENFAEASEKVTELKTKYMEKRTKPEEKYTKRGYLYLMEKSSLLKISLLEPFKATWTKYYCTYKKQKKEFTMLQFNQMNHSSARPEQRDEEKLTLASCQRRASEFEKRFCFDLTFKEKSGIVYTFQALSEEDRRAWINAMDGTEPTYFAPGKVKASEEYHLDEAGFAFIRKCIEVLENRGLEDEGLYRKSGVGTKITKLLCLGMDRKKLEVVFSDEHYRDLMESNTIASALKTYLRNLNEPLMTYRLHRGFIEAAKQESLSQRVHEVNKLVHKLPQANFEMLDTVIRHLREVSRKYERNKMSVFNLGVVFGPTLLRPQEETVAAILDIKFNNIVINILIENYEHIFKGDRLTSSTTALLSANTSSPTRAVRATPLAKSLVGSETRANSYRASMYSPQQHVYRVIAKSNYTEPSMSSSLQNIPNGLISAHSAQSGVTNTNGDSAVHNNSSGTKSLSVDIKNLHSMSQSDISIRRSGTGADANIYGMVGGINGALTSLHTSPSNSSSLRHEFLMASATPIVSSTTGATNHLYSTSTSGNNGSRLNINKVSPPTVAMHNEGFFDTSADLTGAVGFSGGGMSYAQAKHYSPVAAISTSSSNESVCDSLSSTNGVGVGSANSIARLLNPHNSMDYVQHVSQASSLSTLLGSTCNDVITATTAPSMVGGVGVEYSPNGVDYAPQKVLRNKDVSQIKRDLSAGTARVRTLYACMGESEGELSFEPNQIITNVRFSHEPGWLQGSLNGKTGLIPENYVEHLKPFH